MHALLCLLAHSVLPIRLLAVVSELSPVAPHGAWGVGSKCEVITSACAGGYPTLQSWVTELSHNTLGTVMATTPDTRSRFITAHPEGVAFNYRVWKKLGTNYVVFADDYYLTKDGKAREAADFVRNSPIPFSLSDLHITDVYLEFLHLFDRYYVTTIGGSTVAVIQLWSDAFTGKSIPSYKHSEILPVLTASLRRKGASQVVALLFGEKTDEGFIEETYSRYDIDVVVCNYGARNASVQNGTQFFMVANSYSLMALDLIGGDMWTYELRVEDLSAPIPAGHDQAVFVANTEWMQAEQHRAAAHDYEIAYSSRAMEASHLGSVAAFYAPCRERECMMGGLATDAIRSHANTDIALLNGGALRGAGWPPGSVKRSDIYSAFPFTDTICTMNVSGTTLMHILDHSLSVLLANGSYDVSSGVGSYAQVSGMRYSFNPANPVGQRVVSVEIFDEARGRYEAVHRRRLYSFATIQYLVYNGDGFAAVLAGRVEGSLRCSVMSTLEAATAYLERHSPYMPSNPNASWINHGAYLNMQYLTAENCSGLEYFLPEWADCKACVAGFFRPAGATECVHETVSTTDTVTNTWLIVGLVAGALVLLFAPLVWKMTEKSRRIRQLYNNNKVAEECAIAVKELRLSDLDYLRDLQKPNTIQTAFIDIATQMKIYVDFMPKTLIANVRDEPASTVRPNNDDEAVRAIDAESSLSSTESLRSRKADGSIHTCFVRQKQVSVMCTNSRSHRTKCEGMDPTSLIEFHSTYMEIFHAAVESQHGVAEAASGDRLIAGWNAVTTAVNHRQLAVRAAYLIKVGCEKHSFAAPLLVNIGVGAGTAKVGLFGGRGTRKFDIITAALPMASTLMLLNKVYDTHVLLPEKVASEVQGQYALQIVDHVSYPKFGSTFLYTLVHENANVKAREWMYELQDHEAGDRFAEHNRAWRVFVKTGKVPEGGTVLWGKLQHLSTAVFHGVYAATPPGLDIS